MYICIIANAYPTSKYPLAGIFEFDQAKALKALGHKVVFLTVDLRSLRRKRKWGKYYTEKDGIMIYNISIPLGRIPFKLLYRIGRIALCSVFKNVIKEQGLPEIIHAHSTMIGAIASIIRKEYHLPLVITEHSSLVNIDVCCEKVTYYANIAYRCADKLIAVSSYLQKRIRENFQCDSIVIPNIVDINSINRTPQQHDVFTFISIGNLIPGKGFDLLISAFQLFKDENIQLWIIGAGNDRASLVSLISGLGLEKQVFLLGLKDRKEISAYLNKSDVFVLASRGETFGVAYIEAMLAGLPVIATRCGGPEDFVKAENGVLIPIDDIEALREALKLMYERHHLYEGDKIAKECLNQFAPEVIALRLQAVYKQLLGYIF